MWLFYLGSDWWTSWSWTTNPQTLFSRSCITYEGLLVKRTSGLRKWLYGFCFGNEGCVMVVVEHGGFATKSLERRGRLGIQHCSSLAGLSWVKPKCLLLSPLCSEHPSFFFALCFCCVGLKISLHLLFASLCTPLLSFITHFLILILWLNGLFLFNSFILFFFCYLFLCLLIECILFY